jgi:hypothetical protein
MVDALLAPCARLPRSSASDALPVEIPSESATIRPIPRLIFGGSGACGLAHLRIIPKNIT